MKSDVTLNEPVAFNPNRVRKIFSRSQVGRAIFRELQSRRRDAKNGRISLRNVQRRLSRKGLKFDTKDLEGPIARLALQPGIGEIKGTTLHLVPTIQDLVRKIEEAGGVPAPFKAKLEQAKVEHERSNGVTPKPPTQKQLINFAMAFRDGSWVHLEVPKHNLKELVEALSNLAKAA